MIRFAALDAPLPDDVVQPHDTAASVIAGYRAASAQAYAVVRTAGLGEPCRDDDSGTEPVNLRSVLANLLEETARHAGYEGILRELIDGSTGR